MQTYRTRQIGVLSLINAVRIRTALFSALSAIVAAVLLRASVAEACAPPPSYTLTLTITGNGTVNLNPPNTNFTSSTTQTYSSGTSVTLTATPASGYLFDHWSGDVTGSTTPKYLTMNSNKTVTAVFVAQTFVLSTAFSGTGTVSLSPSGGSYTSGTNVTVTATPGSGWRFDHWTGDLSGSTNPAALTMNANKSVTAVFIQRFTLTTATTGTGTVALSPTGGTYDTGTSVTVTATAGSGWRFDHWSGDLSGSTNLASLTMTANKSITAVFVQTFTLTTATTGTGTVALSPTGGTYDTGTTVTVTATAGTGWRFDHWTGDLIGTTNPTSVTMTANKSVTAVFIQRFTLTTATTGTGTVALSPTGGTYDTGSSVTVTATAGSGWRFDHWAGDLSGSTDPTSLTMTANKSITAVFVQTFTLTTATTGTGTVALSPTGGTYDTGSSVTVTATTGSGWRFDHWTGDLSGSTNPASLTMTANKSVTAVFIQRFTLTTATTGTGTVALSPSGGTYDTGSSVTATATPGSGWRFDHWTGDLSGSTNPAALTMNANKSVTAVFVQTFTLTTATTGTGTVALSPIGGIYDTGTSVTVTATAGSGWRFDHWTGDLTGSTNPASLTINANKSVSAFFVQTFTLATATTGTGTVALSPTGGTYDTGSSVTVTATPGSGWRFDHWTGDVGGSDNQKTLTMDTSKSITAVFSDTMDLSGNTPLEQALAAVLQAQPPLSIAAVQALTSLDLSGQTDITSLSGIELATSLTDLNLGVNQLTDLSPLIYLTNIETLTISNAMPASARMYAAMTKLVTLRILDKDTGAPGMTARWLQP